MCTESNYDSGKIRFSPKINNVHVYIFRLFVFKSVRDVHSGIPRVVIRRGLPVELPQIIAALLFWGEAASKIPGNSTYCAPLYFLRRSLRLGF